ncbi:MAG: class I SAM-dependent methyltransferase [Anaerolineae bacterium]|nr:class I SAM-dependent methyltransferase [Anaerolineae bacterium]
MPPSAPPDDNPADNKPLALDAYEQLAERYDARIDTKPHNAYYERPATLALLPEVAGQHVLDAGCGPGWYAAWMLDRGADVVALDASPTMIALAQKRTGGRGEFHRADMSQPLDFLAGESFDLVLSALAIHYVPDAAPLFAEFARVLKPGGRFVFSTAHPMFDYLYFKSDNYFAVEPVGVDWDGFGGDPVYVPCYRQPLQHITEALWRTGFLIERIIEPLPTEEFKRADPESYEKLLRRPLFIHFRARKG